MFIERIEAEKFGALTAATIDRLGPGVQVLYGTNETGKTTLLEFIRAVFFGFEGLFRRGVLDPQQTCAGRLALRLGPERTLVAIERRHEGPGIRGLTRQSYEDDIVGLGGDVGDLLDVADIDPRSAASRQRLYLQDIVGGIDETTFTSVMAFGLDELHELRTLEPEGCGSRLYELASGLDRSKIARVLAHLRDALARVESTDPAVSPLKALEVKRDALQERLAALECPAVVAGGLWAELAHLDAEIAATDDRIAEAARGEELIRAVLPLEELHAAWRRTAERLGTLESAPLVHPDRDAWRDANRRLRRHARLALRRKKRRGKLARALAGLAEESAVWRKRVAVAAACEELPRLERLAADVGRAEAHSRLAARRFGEQVAVAGLSRVIPIAATIDDSTVLPEVLLPEGFAHSFGPLRARARDLARAARGVTAAKRALAEARRGHAEARGVVKAAGASLGGLSLAQAIEQAGERVTTLRKRLLSGDQLAEVDGSITGLEREVTASLSEQLIPVPWLLGLGALFVAGTGMVLSGLFLQSQITTALAYAFIPVGLLCNAVSAGTTWSLDRSAKVRLESARSRLETARTRRDELLAQCGLLDKRIAPDATTALDRRLAAAQAELDRLEDLGGRDGAVQLHADRVTLAEQGLERARGESRTARQRWRKALEHRGLPATLSPREVRQISTHRHTLLTLDDDRRRLSEEARHKREEVAACARRIDELLVECEIVPESTPLDHLRLLQERLDAEKAQVRRRGSLTRRLEAARRRHRHVVRQVRVAERAVREFYTRWGVTTEQDFLAKVDRRPEHERARGEAEAAETAWLDARRRTSEPADIDRWLAEVHVVPLDRRLADACAVTGRHRAARSALESRRREVAARVEAAARDRGTEPLQVELAEVEERLGAQRDRRRLLEQARRLLEETRAVVARDHQPPVLREASRWLARLTGGRYPAIITAIDEARLDVRDADNGLWSPERLSRGTREQVFLALRLALIRDLGRHDVSLPIVMDDALVNFDDARARAAARVLVEFVAEQAADRQMIVLTCHEHVARIFHESGAHVRSFTDPDPLWGPPAPRSRPVRAIEPAPLPQPVVSVAAPEPVPEPPSVEPSPDLWPAEAFFFGPSAARPASPAPAADRRGGRRQAARPHRRR
jgi:uncharacterized protein YhaN